MKLPTLLIAAVLSLGATSSFAQITPAQSLTVTQSSNVAGTPSTFRVQFTSVVPTYTSDGGAFTGAFLDVIVPNTYSVANLACNTIAINIGGTSTTPTSCAQAPVSSASGIANPLPPYPNNSIRVSLLLANTVSVPQSSAVSVTFPSGALTATTVGTKAIRVDQTNQSANTPGLQRSEGTIAIGAPTPVPTLSEWAMILLGMILAGAAALVLQRRQLGV